MMARSKRVIWLLSACCSNSFIAPSQTGKLRSINRDPSWPGYGRDRNPVWVRSANSDQAGNVEITTIRGHAQACRGYRHTRVSLRLRRKLPLSPLDLMNPAPGGRRFRKWDVATSPFGRERHDEGAEPRATSDEPLSHSERASLPRAQG